MKSGCRGVTPCNCCLFTAMYYMCRCWIGNRETAPRRVPGSEEPISTRTVCGCKSRMDFRWKLQVADGETATYPNSSHNHQKWEPGTWKICYPELPETFTSIIIFPIKQCGFVWNCWAQQSTGWSCFSQLKHLKTAILRVVNPTILNADLGSRYTSMKSIHQGIVDSWNELLNGLSRGYNNCKG
jgi:hypothetical protein